jgi:hypothetical protein
MVRSRRPRRGSLSIFERGDIAFQSARAGAIVSSVDVTHRILGCERRQAPGPVLFSGDMIALRLPRRLFDLVTAGYGFKRPRFARAMTIHRVLHANALMSQFQPPRGSIVRAVYLPYLNPDGAVLRWLLHRDRTSSIPA